MVVCVHLPRFELTVAAGGAEALAGRALAIAPAPGGEARVGEVSGAAEASGCTRGMVLGEALARCPELRLVAGDPLGVAQAWERAARALEGIGAALELARAGLAYFEADGLRGLHGGDEGCARRRARDALRRAPFGVGRGPDAVLLRSRRRWRSARVAPALVGERQPRPPLPRLPTGGAARLPRGDRRARGAPERLGVRTLGALAALGRDAVADRFGAPGALARRLALGEDTRCAHARVEERLRGVDGAVGGRTPGRLLERVLGVLVDRLLARPERRGRTLRALTLSARLVERGTWRERVVFREALSDPRRIRLALAQRLQLLPAPAAALRLAVEEFGPPERRQGGLLDGERTARRARGCGRPWVRCDARRPERRTARAWSSTPTRACPSGGSLRPCQR